MVRTCDHPDGCTKQPSFGKPGSRSARRCAAHKEEGMEDVVNRRCDHPSGCRMQPSHGLRGSKTATRCAAHKENGMVKIQSWLRDHPNGGLSEGPNFVVTVSKTTTKSQKHVEDRMALADIICYHPGGCRKRPCYGLSGHWATRCEEHRDVDMVLMMKGSRKGATVKGASVMGKGEPR